ncbi:putative flavin-binding monooxygenase-like protein [Rosellinia necatrix]|uniref:Putative flavin-binding monooxygenase-like protein n=1 Tax=Rosellinia necatrix TaxID=77044 RepID=A0A1S7UH78_ROSNE|nr:putative flavin-binding monooxygenase-like protein [Rosellinia necatrix]
MENPEQDIKGVISSLTQGKKEEQENTLNRYFLPNAYFVHPFCRVPSFEPIQVQLPFYNFETINSRRLVQFVYQWYRILSPDVVLEIDSTAFDEKTNSLYATIRQTFTLWVVPFHLWEANVRLVCLLKLEHLPVDKDENPIFPQNRSGQNGYRQNTAPSTRRRYFIQGQEDHYQTNDMLKFVAPFGASALWYLWQLFATLVCVIGVALLWPVTWIYERKLIDSTKKVEGSVRPHR